MAGRDAPSLLLALWNAARAADSRARIEMRAAGVADDELAVLLTLAQAGRGLTTTELASRVGAAFMTTSDAAARLEGRGDVERIPNPADRRSHLLALTDLGAARAAAARAPLERALASLVGEDGLSASEMRDLQGLLLRVGNLTDP